MLAKRQSTLPVGTEKENKRDADGLPRFVPLCTLEARALFS